MAMPSGLFRLRTRKVRLAELLLGEKNSVEWEDVGIERGLANYNALEIQK